MTASLSLMGAGRAGITFVLLVAVGGWLLRCSQAESSGDDLDDRGAVHRDGRPVVALHARRRVGPCPPAGDTPNSQCTVTSLGTRLAGWAPGNPVTVYDQNGHILGTATVPAGQVTQGPAPDPSGVGRDFTCSWYVGVRPHPADNHVPSVRCGRTDHGHGRHVPGREAKRNGQGSAVADWIGDTSAGAVYGQLDDLALGRLARCRLAAAPRAGPSDAPERPARGARRPAG